MSKRRERYWVHSQPDDVTDADTPCVGPHHCPLHDQPVHGCRSCPQPTPGRVCDDCRDRLRRILGELPRLWVELAAAIVDPGMVAASGTTAGPVSGGGDEAPLGLHTGADALARDIVWVVESVAEDVRAVAGLAVPQERRRLSVVLAQAVAVLAPRVDVILALPTRTYVRPKSENAVSRLDDETVGWMLTSGEARVQVDLDGVGLLCELVDLHTRARRLLGRTRGRRHYPDVPCPGCWNTTLVRWYGLDAVECTTPGCRFVTTEDQLDRWSAMLAAEGRAWDEAEAQKAG